MLLVRLAIVIEAFRNAHLAGKDALAITEDTEARVAQVRNLRVSHAVGLLQRGACIDMQMQERCTSTSTSRALTCWGTGRR